MPVEQGTGPVILLICFCEIKKLSYNTVIEVEASDGE